MSKPVSERRTAENEVVFREFNERIKKGFDEIKKIAKEDGQEPLIDEIDEVLHFYCECSDENCRKRVKLRPSRYNEIHQRRDRFVIACGHDVKSIEHVIDEETDFCIVEKFIMPPKSASALNQTETNNF